MLLLSIYSCIWHKKPHALKEVRGEGPLLQNYRLTISSNVRVPDDNPSSAKVCS